MPRLREHKWADFSLTGYNTYWRDCPLIMAVDTETTGLTWQDWPFGMTVSWQGPDRIESFWWELEDEGCRATATELLLEHAIEGRLFLCHQLKFDKRMLTNFGGMWPQGARSIDTLPMAALLDPIGDHRLKPTAKRYLGVETHEDAAVKKARKKLGLTKEDGYYLLPREVVVPYAMKDTEYTLRLYHHLLPLLEERGLMVAHEKEQRVVEEFLRMEMRGLRVIPEKVKENIKLSDAIIAEARGEIETLVGRKVGKAKKKVRVENGISEKTGKQLWKTVEVPDDFNPNSPQQLLEVFRDRGHDLSSTGADVLDDLDDPLVDPLIRMRDDEKLRNTYLAPLLEEMDENGIVHPNINSNGTATGRASSGAVKEG